MDYTSILYYFMEEIIGAAPTSSTWKADVLADKLYLHNEGERNRTFHHVPKPVSYMTSCIPSIMPIVMTDVGLNHLSYLPSYDRGKASLTPKPYVRKNGVHDRPRLSLRHQ